MQSTVFALLLRLVSLMGIWTACVTLIFRLRETLG